MKVTTFRFSPAFMLLLALCAAVPAFAGDKPRWFDPARHLSLDRIERGMTGYGLSIFYGTKIERFDVRVLDVVRNYFEPKRSAIIVELTGHGLERTGVIEGMSGSPVYLKDPSDGKFKIVGAVAFGWPMPCPGPAICGIQPIEEMMVIPPNQTSKPMYASADRTFIPSALKVLASRTGQPRPLKEFDRFNWAGVVADPGNQAFADQPHGDLSRGGLYPLATPLGIAGISNRTVAQLSSILSPMNLTVVKAGAGSGGSAGDQAGSMETAGVLAIPLATGDLTMAAVGTATDVSGDYVWGFGHSLFAQGPIELPLAAGVIHTIVPNQMNSFKLGSPFKPIGTLYSDEKTGVAGKIGSIPKMVPMDIKVTFDGNVQTYHYDLAIHDKLAPLLVMVCVQSSALASKELPDYHSIRYKGYVDFEQFGRLSFANSASDSGLGSILADIGEPINLLLNNEFQRVKFTAIRMEIEIIPKSEGATIKQAKLDKAQYRPGEQARVEMVMTRVRGPEFTHVANFTVPQDLPDGEYDVTIGGLTTGVMADRKSNPYIYKPQDARGVFDMAGRILSFGTSKFYIAINTQEQGLGVRRFGMRLLPGSKLQQLQNADPGLTEKFAMTRMVDVPAKFVVDGQESLKLVISRNQ